MSGNFETLTTGPMRILLRAVCEGRPILIRISGKLVIGGNLIAYDRNFSMILKNAIEIRTDDEGKKHKKKLGNTFIRGTATQVIISDPGASLYEE